ncbi:hypothetical protein [Cryptosporangium aurantiacum]|uniref:Uncharacterized protein n=1 Tax=Cryptosporangium aurantiacum TaxID=134849 RepID=A0A1M7R7T3_9ACTN|nr:hypothetical protein [Cryptosporangium aurantiacum]SHN42108.1 hypothetical protein SAMN05443668_10882 [Cryptosporangium aurantiacum]
MPRSQSKLEVESPSGAQPDHPATQVPQAAGQDTPADPGQALRLAVSQQAELLALLTGSARAGVGALDETPPSGTVDLIGALGPLERPDVPGSDPLRAFAVVAPRFAQDAEQVITDLGGRGQAA